jgi:hypothetical protein
VRTAHSVASGRTDARERWPAYAAAAGAAGYWSMLALPLRTTGAPFGVLTLYAQGGAAPAADLPAERFATWAAVAIANSRLYARTRELVGRLDATEPDSDVEVATGIVVADRRCGSAEALAWLAGVARDRGADVASVARDVVAARSSRDL